MQFDHKNRQIRPTTKLISEFFLVVPSISRFFSLKCREKRGKTVYTLPVTQILDLFSLFTCLFTSQQRGRALKKLKATTITKLKIGFLTTLSSECIWQQFFFTNFFEFLLPTKMPFLKRFYSHEFFLIFIAYENAIFKAFLFSRIFQPKFEFFLRSKWRKYGSKN